MHIPHNKQRPVQNRSCYRLPAHSQPHSTHSVPQDFNESVGLTYHTHHTALPLGIVAAVAHLALHEVIQGLHECLLHMVAIG